MNGRRYGNSYGLKVSMRSITLLHISDSYQSVPGAVQNAFWSVGVQMARTEGVLSLMNGFSASMLRELVYSGFRLGTYEFFKDQCVFHLCLLHVD